MVNSFFFIFRLSFNVQSKLQAPPLKIRYKISPPPEHTFNQNCASPLFSATGSPSSSATGRSQLSLDFQEFDWASQPQPAPKKGDNFLMVNLPCDENIFVLEVSLEVTRPLLDSASQSSCVTIEQPTFSLSTACKPKYVSCIFYNRPIIFFRYHYISIFCQNK